MQAITELQSIDGIEDFGHYYVCIKPLTKHLKNHSNHYIEKQTGLDHHTVKKLLAGTHLKSDHKVIERICFCFMCDISDFCFYTPPNDSSNN